MSDNKRRKGDIYDKHKRILRMPDLRKEKIVENRKLLSRTNHKGVKGKDHRICLMSKGSR
jgi:hypothetical protein